MEKHHKSSAGGWSSSGLFSLYINNKHGSLVYQKDFSPAVNLSANDKIILASTYHGLSGIAAQLSSSPSKANNAVSVSDTSGESANAVSGSSSGRAKIPKFMNFLQSRGISLIESDAFCLECFESMTGLRFFIVAMPGQHRLEGLLKRVYEVYSDYVLKNPFHDVDMPIRCELFDKQIEKLFKE